MENNNPPVKCTWACVIIFFLFLSNGIGLLALRIIKFEGNNNSRLSGLLLVNKSFRIAGGCEKVKGQKTVRSFPFTNKANESRLFVVYYLPRSPSLGSPSCRIVATTTRMSWPQTLQLAVTSDFLARCQHLLELWHAHLMLWACIVLPATLIIPLRKKNIHTYT